MAVPCKSATSAVPPYSLFSLSFTHASPLLTKMKVTIEPHNPAWASQFASTKKDLEESLSGIPIKSIEHVGSTSIPGLPAKPVLDIDIIASLDVLPAVRAALAKSGYFDQGEMGVPGRFQFRQPGYGPKDAAFGSHSGAELRRNTYVMIEGSLALKNHVDIKRVLMEDKDLKEEYGNIKLELAEKEYEFISEYGRGKRGILRKILVSAGWGEEELSEVIGPIEEKRAV